MTIHEPMTLATDYLITIAAAIFAARLWRTDRLWSLAFVFTALGSLFGGTFHGFGDSMTPFAETMLWKATMFSIALASFFLLAGAGSRVLAAVAVIKLVASMSWMIVQDDFLWVIVDYGITLLLVGGVQLVAWIRTRAPSAPWVLGSIVVSVLGALVQQFRIAPHPSFNHNDLYHVIQIVALWMLYRGAAAGGRYHTDPRRNT